jgi:hypothetical protein
MKITSGFIALFLLFTAGFTSAQEGTQVVRGTILDNVSESPIPGAKVVILNTNPILRTLTDSEGYFKISNVPIGRHDIVVTYMGYDNAVLKGVVVDAGKETIINTSMVERIVEKDAVIVKADKDKPKNEMSLVSTRTFSVEETQKYAAALNDPARMATSFAGVVATEGINNDISVRGNSPRGLIWRMEGVEIPNPNHFSGVGTSGGGISIISAQLMGNSDFSTGAFAAEYGNALSGIFDLSLRKGNNEKREFTVQAGVLGLDIAMEGPFKKGYEGSYLFNYRYSTLGLVSQIVPLGDNITTFQDLSFNIYLPTKKYGKFGIFGLGGISSDSWSATEDTTVWQAEPWKQYQGAFTANTGVVGVWHKGRFGKNGFLKTNIAVSGTNNGDYDEELDYSFVPHLEYDEEFIQKRLTISTVYTHKISAKTNLKSGFIYNRIGFNLRQNEYENEQKYVILDEKGAANTLQGFFQMSHKINEKMTVNAGGHYLHLLLNNTYNIEPRFSMGYKMSPRQSINVGYGHHSQIQPLGSYFASVTNAQGIITRPNRDLKLNKAHHAVLSYSLAIDEIHKLKAEVYFQHLYNIPLGARNDSTFSLINDDYGFETSELVSSGIGRNYGIELTFDRSLKNGFYYLVSGALFESKYQAMNGNWYDTRFNSKFTFVVTAGKEWTLKNKEKKRTLGLNIKSILTGGLRYTGFDLSTLNGIDYPELNYTRSFEESMPAYYRLDVRMSLKRNYKKVTSTVSLDLQNALNRKIPGGQYFDMETGDAKYWYHPGIIPVLSYRLTF